MRTIRAIDRHISILAVLVAIATMFCTSAVHSIEVGSLIGDPIAAKEFDYCEWAYGDRESYGSLPDLKDILNKSAGNYSDQAVVSALLVKAGTKVALAAKTRRVCKRELKDGLKLFDKKLRKNTRSLRKNADFDASEDQEVSAIQSEISRLWVADQAARVTYIELATDKVDGAAYWARQLSAAHAKLADDEATGFMKATLETNDWIDSDRFGVPVSRYAWTLVQHADGHPDFQEEVLHRMQAYLSSGGVMPRDYAYLWDRVAVNTGKLQRYGTQPTWKCENGKLALHPMEDPSNVDKRRAKMGMGTAASALTEMARNTCR